MPWNNQGGGQGPWGQGPSGGGGKPPDLEELLRQGKDKLSKVAPGGSLGGKGILLGLIVLLLIWGFSGLYRVQQDEQGVVLRFGKFIKTTQPGLNYHWPYPIENVIRPKVTKSHQVNIGMRSGGDEFRRSGRRGAVRDVPEESLMLTGDENIVDLDFSVFWIIKDAGHYLFNIQNPIGTVKSVAESAMREIVGNSEIQPILSRNKAKTENAVKVLIQKTLDHYGAGIEITNVQLQKVDPPSQVIDSFRDVQAAKADQERARNEAEAYANKVVPEARGEAARILQEADAYKQKVIAESEGQSARFVSIYNEYKKAPEVTRKRMFLETLEEVLGQMNKVVIDTPGGGQSGVVPYLPLNELMKSGAGAAKESK